MIRLPTILLSGILTGCLLASSPVLAADPGPWQSLEAIRELATRRALSSLPPGGNKQATAGNLDRRLHLANCGGPLQAATDSYRQGQSRMVVAISCPGPKRWKVHVPVTISHLEQVVTTTRQVPRGDVFSQGDLALVERNVTSLASGYFTDFSQVVGQRATRSVRPGQVLTGNSLGAPQLIEKGQAVTIQAQTGGLEIRMAGKALSDGFKEQRIQVMNLSSGRAVEAVVKTNQVVEVLLD